MKYRSGYKYKLTETYSVKIGITPSQDILTDYISLTTDGLLTVFVNYAWDGPSGLTFDTKNFMRGSLVHDALYQLIRLGYLDIGIKDLADKELVKICREDGMNKIYSYIVYKFVERFGNFSLDPSIEKKFKEAP